MRKDFLPVGRLGGRRHSRRPQHTLAKIVAARARAPPATAKGGGGGGGWWDGPTPGPLFTAAAGGNQGGGGATKIRGGKLIAPQKVSPGKRVPTRPGGG